ncbi:MULTISPECIES: hypothetical protein [Treponema]|uniref:Uncharacterized protein TP_0869 n=6 Tax=Treponema TaxID=157 RepID=Y869_TREPA|nr:MULTISPECIES: hypothetical protein [Treponema]O83839.1 RecName: Full=Uncharacterized protein TP_0869 [Treponema pallidum subsp. pallidum str. Nichols]AAC65845.1 predicted coding region TP0869 [Treponema pallidum subsp. pallidum str. Nichols]ACD71285.1 hypothetical protein TPASS_0869 [Treponema pallidum subsp. pallidum SS14]AEH40796.1 hypothetical protein TPCCA_0869 [Treponema paraluiscuniculi Cuniculi A]AEZ58003.1 hypothetical protein TPESAMD_0869 [Treponema pallidum subsp. pertenue str. Sa
MRSCPKRARGVHWATGAALWCPSRMIFEKISPLQAFVWAVLRLFLKSFRTVFRGAVRAGCGVLACVRAYGFPPYGSKE